MTSSVLLSKLHLELLHAGHVVAEHAVLQHGDGVTLPPDLLDLFTCAVTERQRLVQGCCRDALTITFTSTH